MTDSKELEMLCQITARQSDTIDKALDLIDGHYKNLLGSITDAVVSVISPLIGAVFEKVKVEVKPE